MKYKIITLLLLATTIIATQSMITTQAAAINVADFNDGRIIDDELFYDKGGMGSVAQVQDFLNAHVPSCDTWGTRASGYGNLNNAQYAVQVKRWPGPPYPCLNNYHENPHTGETSFEKGGGAFSGGISAAQIIYNAAQEYSINPKVLLVMLRKESANLFGDSWPLKSQYRYAMGYACPDSGPGHSANCNNEKAGFYKQVHYSAWQLRYYYDHMGTYNYTPGRNNKIQYSPNPACGTKDVYIENHATASLYIYTPYTPNDAALNAYPGEAHCGAYGNRNFWFMWQEWFGTTKVDGNFLRTPNDPTVYLIGDGKKYPIADGNLLSAASRLGSVGYVSQAYLNKYPTGQTMGRFMRSPNGTIYFYDANIKLAFTSCQQVADFGGVCGTEPELTQSQINRFVNGPNVTNGMKTTSGQTYYIKSGKKHEIFDNQSLSNEGVVIKRYNTLTSRAFNYLSYGKPIVRNGVVIQDKQSVTNRYLKQTNGLNKLESPHAKKVFSHFPSGKLDRQSIAKLTIYPSPIDDIIKDEQERVYTLSKSGKMTVLDKESLGNVEIPKVEKSLVDKIAGNSTLSTPILARAMNNATVYAIVDGQKRPLISMSDLPSITGQDNPPITWLSGKMLDTMPTGNIITAVGRLVKTPTSATVYMTDGFDELIPMSSFNPAIDLGVPLNILTISDKILSKYRVNVDKRLSSYVTCSNQSYIGINGSVYQLALPNKKSLSLQERTCKPLKEATNIPRFILGPDGTIYERVDTALFPLASMNLYTNLKKSGGDTVRATQSTINLFTIKSTKH